MVLIAVSQPMNNPLEKCGRFKRNEIIPVIVLFVLTSSDVFAQPDIARSNPQFALLKQQTPNAVPLGGQIPVSHKPTTSDLEKASPKRLTILDHFRRWLWRFGRDPIAVFTLFLFVIGGTQFELARRTAQRQLRAYISVNTGVIRFQRLDGYRFQFEPFLKNDGVTPAYDLHFNTTATRILTSDIDNFDFKRVQHGRPSKITLSTEAKTMATSVADAHFSWEELATLLPNGTHRLYVYGTVWYRDTFKRFHYTNFCWHIAFGDEIPIWIFDNRNNDAS